MTEYLIESTLCLVVFYLIFVVFFKMSRHYPINRIVLLFSILFSLLVPILSISLSGLPIQEIEQNERLLQVLSVPNYLLGAESVDVAVHSSLDLSFMLTIIYSLVMLVLLGRFAFHMGILLLKGYRSDKVSCHGYELTLIDEKVNPFTFFNFIFICRADYQSDKLEEELLLHEIAHKNQLHSFDVVLIELLQVFFWFNPFIYLFKRLIKTNHEYLADEFVLRSGASCRDYSHKILYCTFPNKIPGFASGFNRAAGRHVIIKQRLIMLSKFQQKKPWAYHFVLLIPVVSILFITTAFRSNTDIFSATIPSQNEASEIHDKPGVFYADKISWSSQDHKVFIIGDEVKVKYGENNMTGKGRFSFLGKVHLLVINNNPAELNSTIDISGLKCEIVKLTEAEAKVKYGSKGQFGVVEITTTQ